MRRRKLVAILAGAMLAVPCHVAAQTATKTYRLASLPALGPLPGNYATPLMQTLAQRGYVDGQNLSG